MHESDDAVDRDEDITDTIDIPASRRGLLSALAGMGAMGVTGTAEGESVSTTIQSTGLDYGGKYTSDPSSNHGLWLQPSGARFGMIGISDATNGRGILGQATASNLSDTGVGILGNTKSPEGEGIRGQNDATSGAGVGVLGVSKSPVGSGIKARNDAPKGLAYGGLFQTFSSEGRGFLGIAEAASGNTFGAIGKSRSVDGVGFEGAATAETGETVGVSGKVNSPDGYGFDTPNDARVGGTVEVGGDLQVSGTKHFVQAAQTPSGPVDVVYTSIESGTPHTEVNDVAEMEDGRATIDLPDHFGLVTSKSESLTVQVTPYADEPVQPQVVERSTDRIVVEDFGDGPQDYSFGYTVTGVRDGFENQPVVREPGPDR